MKEIEICFGCGAKGLKGNYITTLVGTPLCDKCLANKPAPKSNVGDNRE